MYPAFHDFIKEVWQRSPGLIVLFVGGFIVFTLLVIDTFRHRKHRKQRHRVKHFHWSSRH